MALWKLSDVRQALEEARKRPVTTQSANKYTYRGDFPAPVKTEPYRLWDSEEVKDWLTKKFDFYFLEGYKGPRPVLWKMTDIRAALEERLGRPVSRQLADGYARRADFPEPVKSEPYRLWDGAEIEAWLKKPGLK